jgi:hypothetical protein
VVGDGLDARRDAVVDPPAPRGGLHLAHQAREVKRGPHPLHPLHPLRAAAARTRSLDPLPPLHAAAAAAAACILNLILPASIHVRRVPCLPSFFLRPIKWAPPSRCGAHVVTRFSLQPPSEVTAEKKRCRLGGGGCRSRRREARRGRGASPDDDAEGQAREPHEPHVHSFFYDGAGHLQRWVEGGGSGVVLLPRHDHVHARMLRRPERGGNTALSRCGERRTRPREIVADNFSSFTGILLLEKEKNTALPCHWTD